MCLYIYVIRLFIYGHYMLWRPNIVCIYCILYWYIIHNFMSVYIVVIRLFIYRHIYHLRCVNIFLLIYYSVYTSFFIFYVSILLYLQICQCPALFSLDEPTLAKVLQSDFLQASELDVLKAIINWSEHQLIRRLESRGIVTCYILLH